MSEENTTRSAEDIEAANVKTLADLSAGMAKLRELQGEQLVVDLDAAWDEHTKADTPIVFKFQGKTYEVPSSMPADFGRFYRRHCLKPAKDPKTGEPVVMFVIPDGELMFEFMETLAGPEFVDAWSKTRIPMAVLATHVIGPVMRAWQLFIEEGDANGENGATGDAEKKSQTPAS